MEATAQNSQNTQPVTPPAATPRSAKVTPLYPNLPPGAPHLGAISVRDMTSATLRAVEGAPGGWGHVLAGTALRAGLIGGALYLYPGKSKKLSTIAGQSLVASSAITVVLLAAHAVLHRTA